jgi:hypothetical protein
VVDTKAQVVVIWDADKSLDLGSNLLGARGRGQGGRIRPRERETC